MEYTRFVVITDDMIYQTDNESDAHAFAAKCEYGRVAFYELPDQETFDWVVSNVIESGEYENHMGV